MSLNSLLDQFLGSSSNAMQSASQAASDATRGFGDMTSKIPGGLVGGAAAGGIVALLAGNKSARKFAGKAATYGGAALLGGLAYKAFQNWQQQAPADNPATTARSAEDFHQQALADKGSGLPFELTLIRAMIAAARADGHIDAEEQAKIFSAVDRMQLSSDHKALVFDSLQQDIAVQQLAADARSLEQKSELFLASCVAINPDHPSEKAHLDALAQALQLPPDLRQHLEQQASKAFTDAA